MRKARSDTKANQNPKPKGKGEKPPDDWGPILRGAFAELSARSWLQNFLVGASLLLVWPLIGATIMKSYRAAIIGFGIGATCLIWIGVWVLYRQTSTSESPVSETELHGVLTPSNEPDLDHPCLKKLKPPPNSVGLFYGDSAAWITAQVPKFVVLQVEDDELLSITKEPDGVSVSANIFSADGRIVAQIINNKFHINPNNYFRIEPTRHSLAVYDQHAKRVLDVKFLNPASVQVLGIFHHPLLASPVIIDNQSIKIAQIGSDERSSKDVSMSGFCFSNAPRGILFSKEKKTVPAIIHFALP